MDSNSATRKDHLKLAKRGLRKGLNIFSPGTHINAKGYTESIADNLVSSVMPADFESDLKQGSGNEDSGKVRATHSSSALVVNCFGPFKRHLSDLQICGTEGLTSLHFEKKCPTGLRGTPPNLDLLTEHTDHIVAIESKCTEYLSPHPADFSTSYETKICDARRESSWFREMQRLIKSPRTYSCLDAAQLIKHAFGLLNCYPGRKLTLLYLYWEPINAVDFPIFEEHRSDIAAFSEMIAGSHLDFEAMTYNDLWSSWDETAPQWLSKHLRDLRERYAVTI